MGKVTDQAYVTLATNDVYSLGALVLANSLKDVKTNRELVVIITPMVTENMRNHLNAVYDNVVCVDVMESNDEANLALSCRPELGVTFTKINCWKLTQYKKCVFLDSDCLVIKNCDELFDRDELSAVPDIGWPDCFNSGVLVYVPSEETFKALLELAVKHGSFDGGDQGLLNTYFSSWATKDIAKHLSFIYNMACSVTYTYLPAYKRFMNDVKIIHFIGPFKPWNCTFDHSTGRVVTTGLDNFRIGHLQMWWDVYQKHVNALLNTQYKSLLGVKPPTSVSLPDVPQRTLSDKEHKDAWEEGHIDYMGADAFENIQRHIESQVQNANMNTFLASWNGHRDRVDEDKNLGKWEGSGRGRNLVYDEGKGFMEGVAQDKNIPTPVDIPSIPTSSQRANLTESSEYPKLPIGPPHYQPQSKKKKSIIKGNNSHHQQQQQHPIHKATDQNPPPQTASAEPVTAGDNKTTAFTTENDHHHVSFNPTLTLFNRSADEADIGPRSSTVATTALMPQEQSFPTNSPPVLISSSPVSPPQQPTIWDDADTGGQSLGDDAHKRGEPIQQNHSAPTTNNGGVSRVTIGTSGDGLEIFPHQYTEKQVPLAADGIDFIQGYELANINLTTGRNDKLGDKFDLSTAPTPEIDGGIIITSDIHRSDQFGGDGEEGIVRAVKREDDRIQPYVSVLQLHADEADDSSMPKPQSPNKQSPSIPIDSRREKTSPPPHPLTSGANGSRDIDYFAKTLQSAITKSVLSDDIATVERETTLHNYSPTNIQSRYHHPAVDHVVSSLSREDVPSLSLLDKDLKNVEYGTHYYKVATPPSSAPVIPDTNLSLRHETRPDSTASSHSIRSLTHDEGGGSTRSILPHFTSITKVVKQQPLKSLMSEDDELLYFMPSQSSLEEDSSSSTVKVSHGDLGSTTKSIPLSDTQTVTSDASRQVTYVLGEGSGQALENSLRSVTTSEDDQATPERAIIQVTSVSVPSHYDARCGPASEVIKTEFVEVPLAPLSRKHDLSRKLPPGRFDPHDLAAFGPFRAFDTSMPAPPVLGHQDRTTYYVHRTEVEGRSEVVAKTRQRELSGTESLITTTTRIPNGNQTSPQSPGLRAVSFTVTIKERGGKEIAHKTIDFKTSATVLSPLVTARPTAAATYLTGYRPGHHGSGAVVVGSSADNSCADDEMSSSFNGNSVHDGALPYDGSNDKSSSQSSLYETLVASPTSNLSFSSTPSNSAESFVILEKGRASSGIIRLNDKAGAASSDGSDLRTTDRLPKHPSQITHVIGSVRKSRVVEDIVVKSSPSSRGTPTNTSGSFNFPLSPPQTPDLSPRIGQSVLPMNIVTYLPDTTADKSPTGDALGTGDGGDKGVNISPRLTHVTSVGPGGDKSAPKSAEVKEETPPTSATGYYQGYIKGPIGKFFR